MIQLADHGGAYGGGKRRGLSVSAATTFTVPMTPTRGIGIFACSANYIYVQDSANSTHIASLNANTLAVHQATKSSGLTLQAFEADHLDDDVYVLGTISSTFYLRRLNPTVTSVWSNSSVTMAGGDFVKRGAIYLSPSFVFVVCGTKIHKYNRASGSFLGTFTSTNEIAVITIDAAEANIYAVYHGVTTAVKFIETISVSSMTQRQRYGVVGGLTSTNGSARYAGGIAVMNSHVVVYQTQDTAGYGNEVEQTYMFAYPLDANKLVSSTQPSATFSIPHHDLGLYNVPYRTNWDTDRRCNQGIPWGSNSFLMYTLHGVHLVEYDVAKDLFHVSHVENAIDFAGNKKFFAYAKSQGGTSYKIRRIS